MNGVFNGLSRSLAILIDPDKIEHLDFLLANTNSQTIQFFFIGGSGELKKSIDEVIDIIQSKVSTPCIIFPGSSSQLSAKADGLLVLSLLSGRNPDYLNGKLIEKAIKISRLPIQKIPVGYILIDGGIETSTQRITNTLPIKSDNIDLIISTAIAGELLGNQAIYLEAGSGAKVSVSLEIIQAVKSNIKIPLIVGGGIKSFEILNQMWDAGADLLVIGNALEQEPNLLLSLNQPR